MEDNVIEYCQSKGIDFDSLVWHEQDKIKELFWLSKESEESKYQLNMYTSTLGYYLYLESQGTGILPY